MPIDVNQVLIVGAGPVGLMCAHLLARANIPVQVFEKNKRLEDDPRAATTHPATLELLSQAGIEEEAERVGLVAPLFQFWDRSSGDLVAEFDHSLLKNETEFPYVVQCEQFKLARILYDRIRPLEHVQVHFGAEAVGLEMTRDKVILTTKNAHEQESTTGNYLVGADGGRSFVRKALRIPFEGFTWEERFLVLTTPFDFEAELGCTYRSYFADPEEWCNCFKVAGDGPPGLWRTVFPASLDEPEDSLLNDASVQARLQNFFPKSDDFEIVHRNLYQVHQRVAQSFRKGRALLAGDAAHVNNPIGGMGLNGGLQDASNLAEKLIEVWHDRAPESCLDLYDLQRRTVTNEYVQRQTIENKKRLEASEPKSRQRFLDELRATAADPALAKAFLKRTAMIDSQRRASSIAVAD